MHKKGLGLGCALAVLLVCVAVFAEDETFTITTYYPSPYGSYNELSTNKFAVGDTNGDGQLTSADQPNIAGDIGLKPQTGIPTAWALGKAGELAYSSMDGRLYTSNGSTWVAQGGSGPVISLKCSWTGSGAGAGSCSPPPCPSQWTDAGTGCAATGGALISERTTGPEGYETTVYTFYTTGYCEHWCYK